MEQKSLIRSAFLDTVPVMTGYLVLGMGFGIIAQTKGYGVLWVFAMSGLIYAGSMQFVAIDLMAGGASLVTMAVTTLMVNIRHLFYGISMVDRYRGAGRKKPYLIWALTDETYSLVCTCTEEEAERRHRYCFLVSLLDQCYWIAGGVIGALLGGVLPFSTKGIDFALTALFVTVFTEQWLTTKDHFAAVAGVLSSGACLWLFGADVFLIPSMIAITVVLTLRKRWKKEETHE